MPVIANVDVGDTFCLPGFGSYQLVQMTGTVEAYGIVLVEFRAITRPNIKYIAHAESFFSKSCLYWAELI